MVTDTALPNPSLRVDGAFAGGAALGTAYIGSLLALARNGIWFHRVAGNSAGAITAALVAAGYDANQLEFLCAPQGSRPNPPAGLPAGAQPIRFTDFWDMPTKASDVSQAGKRQTLLWKAIRTQILDEILALEVDLPAVSGLAETSTDSITNIPLFPSNLRNSVRSRVNAAFANFPTKMKISIGLQATATWRRNLADRLVDEIIDSTPILASYVNFLADGGVFTGNTALAVMRDLLQRRLGVSPVRFSHLPMDLVVLAADIANQRLVVYSKQLTPQMEVAAAVRQSMSLPLIFDFVRQGGIELMDGGLLENYPFWVYTGSNRNAAGNLIVSDTAADQQRTKLGLTLASDEAAPASWNMPAPPTDDPGIHDIARQKIGASALGGELADSAEVRWLGRIGDIAKTFLKAGETTERHAVLGARASYPFHEVRIPVKGFSGLDFGINSDIAKFNAIAARGWQATMATIAAGDLVPAASRNSINPYAPLSFVAIPVSVGRFNPQRNPGP